MPAPGTGVYMGFGLLGLALFVLSVTAFHAGVRENETWKALATAIILTGLLEFSTFVQQALLRQQEAQIAAEQGKVAP